MNGVSCRCTSAAGWTRLTCSHSDGSEHTHQMVCHTWSPDLVNPAATQGKRVPEDLSERIKAQYLHITSHHITSQTLHIFNVFTRLSALTWPGIHQAWLTSPNLLSSVLHQLLSFMLVHFKEKHVTRSATREQQSHSFNMIHLPAQASSAATKNSFINKSAASVSFLQLPRGRFCKQPTPEEHFTLPHNHRLI